METAREKIVENIVDYVEEHLNASRYDVLKFVDQALTQFAEAQVFEANKKTIERELNLQKIAEQNARAKERDAENSEIKRRHDEMQYWMNLALTAKEALEEIANRPTTALDSCYSISKKALAAFPPPTEEKCPHRDIGHYHGDISHPTACPDKNPPSRTRE